VHRCCFLVGSPLIPSVSVLNAFRCRWKGVGGSECSPQGPSPVHSHLPFRPLLWDCRPRPGGLDPFQPRGRPPEAPHGHGLFSPGEPVCPFRVQAGVEVRAGPAAHPHVEGPSGSNVLPPGLGDLQEMG